MWIESDHSLSRSYAEILAQLFVGIDIKNFSIAKTFQEW